MRVRAMAGLFLACAAAAAAPSDAPQVCVALRGNGELVMAHLAGLSRILEEEGLIDGAAGGSSSTITMFLYESVLKNPQLRDCGACSQREVARRAALLLKSVREWFSVAAESDEVKAIEGLGRLMSKAQQEGLSLLLKSGGDEDVKAAIARMRLILSSPELRDLINHEVFALFDTPSPLARLHAAREIFEALSHFGDFSAGDPRIFFRPGLLDFAEGARRIARIGDFLAGYGPFYEGPAMKDFLKHCTFASIGKTWQQVQKKSPDCARRMHGMMGRYRAQIISQQKDFRGREEDEVGTAAHLLVITSLIRPPESERLEKVRHAYLQGIEPQAEALRIFDRVAYAYIGRTEDSQAVAANPRGFADLRSHKALALGPLSWQSALSLSPAEPGLSRLRAIPGTEALSGGGWPDLSPTLALRNIGCKKIIYLTRRGEDSRFGRGIATSLGMTRAQESALYDLANPASSFSVALKEADAVWCTDWDRFSVGQAEALDADAYKAPLLTRDKDLLRNYSRSVMKLKGCFIDRP